MKKEADYTEKEIDKLLKNYNCPECKTLIMAGRCLCCSCYGTGTCPFMCSGYEWYLDIPYSIKCNDGKIIKL